MTGITAPRLLGRALRLGLALSLLLLAFQTGLHSAHHHEAERAAPQCPFASASAHVLGAVVVPPAACLLALDPVEPSVDRGTVTPVARAVDVPEGRAPPRPASA